MTETGLRSCGPVLVWAPGGLDSAVIAEILRANAIRTVVARDEAGFFSSLDEAGAAIVTGEALASLSAPALAEWIRDQPGWSDLPLIVLTDRPEPGGAVNDAVTSYPELGNVTLVERPCLPQTLTSAARSALRARLRQLQLADQLDERQRVQDKLLAVEQRFRAELEDLVRIRTAALEAETADRERAQEALRQSQKMEAVGQLTGGIAHDFNNLLAGISGSLELLEMRLAQGRLADVVRYIRTAQDAARRAASLIQRLLAFSRRQTLDPKVVDPNDLIAGLDDLLQRSVGPAVAIEMLRGGGGWRTRLDPAQFESAILNLCINARDAMAPNGGRITIETGTESLDDQEARERDLSPGQYVAIRVSDTGSGMTPDIVAKVFDPFFTTKPLGQGTGLGLSMVYGFVRQSGGQVKIQSETGRGTTVCLYLPRFIGAATEEDTSGVETAGPGEGETVLVIDDEPAIRMLVAEILQEVGYHILEAHDGSAGLKILQSDAKIDLLITDVGLPGGLNGRQVADAGRDMRPGLRVLFITGYAENAAIGKGQLEAGMSVITKPFVMAALANKVRELIDLKPEGPALP